MEMEDVKKKSGERKKRKDIKMHFPMDGWTT